MKQVTAFEKDSNVVVVVVVEVVVFEVVMQVFVTTVISYQLEMASI